MENNMETVIIGFVLISLSIFIIFGRDVVKFIRGGGVVLTIVVTALLLGSCKSMNINDMGLAYMEKKYGEKFEYSGSFGDSMSGNHSLLAKCASFPDQNIVVKIESYRSKNRVYRDNYLAVKYHTECTGLFQSYATEEFGGATVFCDINTLTLSPELPANATLYEYLEDTSAPLIILVEVKERNFISEEQARRLAERIAARGSNFYISFIVVSDSEYGAYDIKSLDKLVELGKYVRFAAISRMSGSSIQTKWQSGEEFLKNDLNKTS